MCESKNQSPFEFLVFNSRAALDVQGERGRLGCISEATIKELGNAENQSSSDNESDSGEVSPPPPEVTTRKGLSSVLTGIKIPKNPLSDIGDPSEHRLLKITNSPNVGALTELKLNGKGLSQFESSKKLTLSRLYNLSILDLSNNYISDLSDINQCPGLTYLNLSNNLIESLTPLQSLQKLVTLKVSFNKVATIEPLKTCEKLQKLVLHNNQLSSFEITLNILKGFPKLSYLSIFSNPCIYKTRDSRTKILSALKLIKLDKILVGDQSSPNPFRRVTCLRKQESTKDPFSISSNENLTHQVHSLKEENTHLKKELSNAMKILEKLRNEKVDVISK